ncbi:MAG: FHA domain-containing protein [Synechococcus sp.]
MDLGSDRCSPILSPCHVLAVEDCDGTREHPLSDAKYFIGRDIANDICLNSEFASRYHALLLRVPAQSTGDYYYRILDGDLEGNPSTNGLTVNGQKVNSHQLSEGDVISFGPDAKAIYHVRQVEAS